MAFGIWKSPYILNLERKYSALLHPEQTYHTLVLLSFTRQLEQPAGILQRNAVFSFDGTVTGITRKFGFGVTPGGIVIVVVIGRRNYSGFFVIQRLSLTSEFFGTWRMVKPQHRLRIQKGKCGSRNFIFSWKWLLHFRLQTNWSCRMNDWPSIDWRFANRVCF